MQSAELAWWTQYLVEPYAHERMYALYGMRYREFFYAEFQDAGDCVEIGAGPLPVLRLVQARKKIIIDPLTVDYLAITPIHYDDYYLEGYDGYYPEDYGHAADTVLLLNVLDHTDNPDRLILRAQELLRPDGRCLVFVHLGGGDDKHQPVTREDVAGWEQSWRIEKAMVRDSDNDGKAYLAVWRK